MLRNENKNLTEQGNEDCLNVYKKINKIYEEYRAKGYTMEEVFWMINSASNQSLLAEALGGNRK